MMMMFVTMVALLHLHTVQSATHYIVDNIGEMHGKKNVPKDLELEK